MGQALNLYCYQLNRMASLLLHLSLSVIILIK